MTNPSYEHFVTHSITGTKRANGLAPAFLVNMTSDHLISDDSVLHEYEYEQDSDLDDESEEVDDAEDDTAPRATAQSRSWQISNGKICFKAATPSELPLS